MATDIDQQIRALLANKNWMSTRPFSSDIGEAWMVVEEFQNLGFQLRAFADGTWQSAFGSEPTCQWKNGATAMEAICNAALAIPKCSKR